MNPALKIFAHGGESHCAPSDTLPAYRGAIGASAHGILLGVQLTADGVAVCCGNPTLEQTTGDLRAVSEVSAEELGRLDAGAVFRSLELDRDNQPLKKGDDTPWDGARQRRLYHPMLYEFILLFARRTELIFEALPAADSEPDRKAVVEKLLDELFRFGLDRTAMVAGDKSVIKAVKDSSPDTPCAYRAVSGEGASQARKVADGLSCAAVIVDAEDFNGDPGDGPKFIVTSRSMPYALSPAAYTAAAATPGIMGIAARALHETRSLVRVPNLVVEDDFAGTEINRMLWTCGYSKANQDTIIRQDDGLHIEIKHGGEYSGAAALTSYPTVGNFDAQVDFAVDHPHQGTTFELAAIQIDPGYHSINNVDLNRRSVNLTFDVHGAPPYASSERDENDGFRIGWNNGPAVTEFVNHNAQSSNVYNKYGRDVGDGRMDNPSGALRLVRNGGVFNAYYKDKHNRAWVLSGVANVSTLSNEVFLRLGGKHWPKRGKTPPQNAIHFNKFRLHLI